MRDLAFVVSKQKLVKNQKSDFNNIVYGTANYLRCIFKFDSDWNGFAKVADFTVNSKEYPVLITSNKCMIPYEVTKNPVNFTLRVYGKKGDQKIVTNEIEIEQIGEEEE